MGAMDGKIFVVMGAAGINRDTPLGRHAKAEEIARTTLFLVSDASSFSTGGVYMADGGVNAYVVLVNSAAVRGTAPRRPPRPAL